MKFENFITIKYCTKCRFLNRSTWIAQELLMTFEEDISKISLIPDDSSGIFIILVNNKTIWDRIEDGHSINLKLIKQRLRDIIAPKKDLGHSDIIKN